MGHSLSGISWLDRNFHLAHHLLMRINIVAIITVKVEKQSNDFVIHSSAITNGFIVIVNWHIISVN